MFVLVCMSMYNCLVLLCCIFVFDNAGHFCYLCTVVMCYLHLG